ncbi:MAG: DUF4982 domain-containing protein [Rikenellaceae bacterium]|nr:DUF4982 domain-containing protein [Rikenellaceae bacterium]
MVHVVRREIIDERGYLFDDWTPADPEIHRADVVVYSNCDEVELFINGRSIGTKPVAEDDAPTVWTLLYESGTIKAVGKINGKNAAVHEHVTANQAVKISLDVEKDVITNDWDDVVYVTATVTDKNGVRNPVGGHSVKFTLDGPGEIVAVDNSDVFSHERYKSDTRTSYLGKVVAIVRALGDEGVISVKASADGLESDSVDIKINSKK